MRKFLIFSIGLFCISYSLYLNEQSMEIQVFDQCYMKVWFNTTILSLLLPVLIMGIRTEKSFIDTELMILASTLLVFVYCIIIVNYLGLGLNPRGQLIIFNLFVFLFTTLLLWSAWSQGLMKRNK